MKPINITADYINDTEEFKVLHLMGSLTLAYGTERKKNWKAVAFKNAAMAEQVAGAILEAAAALKAREAKKAKKAEEVSNES